MDHVDGTGEGGGQPGWAVPAEGRPQAESPYVPPQADSPYAAQPQGAYGSQAPMGYGQQAPVGYAPQAPVGYANQPGYGGPVGYAPQPYYGQPVPPAQPGTSTLAIVGLVLAFIVPPVGLVLSIVALVRVQRGRVPAKGRGLAIAGTIVGAVCSLIGVLIVLAAVQVVQTQTEIRGAFEDVQDALRNDDCQAYLDGTTENFRAQLGVVTCDDFEAFVTTSQGPQGFGTVPVTDVDVHGTTAVLRTLENVAYAEGGTPRMEAFDYTLVKRDGEWLVDGVALGD